MKIIDVNFEKAFLKAMATIVTCDGEVELDADDVEDVWYRLNEHLGTDDKDIVNYYTRLLYSEYGIQFAGGLPSRNNIT